MFTKKPEQEIGAAILRDGCLSGASETTPFGERPASYAKSTARQARLSSSEKT